MRVLPIALLATSCDLANPCTAGDGSFELYFEGDLQGSGRLELDAIPRIGGAPARLTGGGAYSLAAADGGAAPLAGAGGLALTVATCARGDSTATLDGAHRASDGDSDSGGADTGGADEVGVTLSLQAQKGGWSGTWTATGPDGASATGPVVAAAR